MRPRWQGQVIGVVGVGLGVLAAVAPAAEDLVRYVRPLMGTDSEFRLSNGNTYPAVARPWGMHFWSPVTAKMGDGWLYSYDAHQVLGLRQTHQPSPWIGDYGAFTVSAGTGTPRCEESQRGAWFSHKAEHAGPDAYRVYLAGDDVTAEVTTTERAAVLRFTFPAGRPGFLFLDAGAQGSSVRVHPEARRITGTCRNHRGGVPENFRMYVVAVCDAPFDRTATWLDGTLRPGTTQAAGERVGALVTFAAGPERVVQVRVAASFISAAQAVRNLEREVGGRDFEQVRRESRALWQRQLGRIVVRGGTTAQRETFYSCLYRMLLFPRRFHEVDANETVVHYSPYNGRVLPGPLYTDNGFWDTFRAVFPYFTLMEPSRDAEILEGLVHTYRESGWLPEWASPGHRDCMIGSNSAAIIADAYLKGIRGFDIDTLYEAILKNSEAAGPLHSVGRYGVTYYNRLGYIPYDVGINENVARTLEYSYDDFTILKLAEARQRPRAEIERFARRALNYRNVFDPNSGFMRGRNADGTWQRPFVPEKWGDAFTEGSAWHYTWCVFHDPAGLIRLMGGRQAFVAKLDAVFTSPPVFDDSYYGQQIHEITEMLVADMGQYAHGNQPIQHMPYLYNYAGQPWKTQRWVRTIMDRLYRPTPDGYCGDEDNGQTSAWYVFSALGFYPVCPGSGQYVLGSPLFDEATLHLENGHRFTVRATDNGPGQVYIQSARLNGRPFTRTYLTHDEIRAGGTLELTMGDTPNRAWGARPVDAPYSLTPEIGRYLPSETAP